MATEAQTYVIGILTNRRNAQKSTGHRSLSMSLSAPADLFMQNKPNFRKAQISTNVFATKVYENENHPQAPKKQTQTKPISVSGTPLIVYNYRAVQERPIHKFGVCRP